MIKPEQAEDHIFPRDTSKSYALMAFMERSSPQVDRGPENTVLSFPVVLLWEIVLLLAVTFVLFLFSLIKQAPLEEIANPMVTTNPAKAPWYFVGLQELLEHMHPTLAGVVIPGLILGFLLILPYMDPSREGAGRWFGTSFGRRIVLWTAVYAALVMSVYIVLDDTIRPRELLRDQAPQWVAQGALPAAILALLMALPAVALRRSHPTRREVLMVMFTVMIVSAVVYTVSGFLFRGPGFELHWPWTMPGGYNPLQGL
jgi:quinol-cytochrome oxidoreductase complex cytochrome b subunit